MQFLSIFELIYIPYAVCFNQQEHPIKSSFLSLKSLLKISIILLNLIDIYINFNLIFYEKGQLVLDRKKIARRYFFGQYWLDFIVVISSGFLNHNIVPFFIILYIFNQEINDICQSLQIQEKYFRQYTLTTIIFQVLLLSHILACGFHGVSYYSEKNWILSSELEE